MASRKKCQNGSGSGLPMTRTPTRLGLAGSARTANGPPAVVPMNSLMNSRRFTAPRSHGIFPGTARIAKHCWQAARSPTRRNPLPRRDLTLGGRIHVGHATIAGNQIDSRDQRIEHDYNGADSFTFEASEGAFDSNVATVTLTVNPANGC